MVHLTAGVLVASILLAPFSGADERAYEAGLAGITCKGCAREVKDLLTKVDGVKSCEVDVKANTATITMNSGKTLDQAGLEKALKGSKFSVTSFKEKKAPESKPKLV